MNVQNFDYSINDTVGLLPDVHYGHSFTTIYFIPSLKMISELRFERF